MFFTGNATGLLCALALSLCGVPAGAAAPGALVFGEAAVALDGPWKFHLGDDPRWADANFDDASWETVDLTPLPGAHDGDVGLTSYVPGWAAHGHRGYTGFAWYRLAVRVVDRGTDTIWLAGPALVDNAYQLYVNGHLIGGIGDFSRHPPGVVGLQPRLFALPRAVWVAQGNELHALIALRVAALKGTFSSTAPDGGGIHIAPVLGNETGVRDHYRLQWLEKVEGYVVDTVEPVAFVLLALLALGSLPFDPADRFNLWISAVLLLLAAAWLNQPLYWLGQFETLRDFVVWRITLIDGLLLGAWLMAWRSAFRLQQPRWILPACAVLTVLYLLARPLSTPILFSAEPAALVAGFALLVRAIRLAFLGLLVLVVTLGWRAAPRGFWAPLGAVLLGSMSVFSREVGQLGVPGIWFPFGVGLSLTECANAAFALALLVYLLQRLWRFAPVVRSASRAGPGNAGRP